mgnify:CR=1 FL=1
MHCAPVTLWKNNGKLCESTLLLFHPHAIPFNVYRGLITPLPEINVGILLFYHFQSGKPDLLKKQICQKQYLPDHRQSF